MVRTTHALAFSLLLVSCAPSQEEIANGDDPIAALGSTVESSRYGLAYWNEQRDADSEIWNEAIAFCEPSEQTNYPNCEAVSQAQFFSGSKKPIVDPRTAPGFGDF